MCLFFNEWIDFFNLNKCFKNNALRFYVLTGQIFVWN